MASQRKEKQKNNFNKEALKYLRASLLYTKERFQ